MNTGEKPGIVCFLRERVQHAFTVFPQGYLKSPVPAHNWIGGDLDLIALKSQLFFKLMMIFMMASFSVVGVREF